MAVVNTKDTNITNLDAAPVVLAPVTEFGGVTRQIAATVEVAGADDDNSVFRIARVPSNARISSIRIFCDAITAGTVYDVGLYRTAADGGAVVAQEAYASDVDLSSGSTTGIEVAFDARNIDKIKNRVWQDAGATSDPNIMYDIALKGTTVGTAAGTISALVSYVID